MPPADLTLAELTKFGIQLEDEGLHPFDPNVEWWNESWFWDWFDDAGTVAGHCRIGLFPAQKRAWVWFFLYHEGEWVAVEEPRLPLGDIQLPRLAYDGWGLRFSYHAREALRRGHLRVAGFGRVLSGARAGTMLPIAADLQVDAVGAPHTTGRNAIPGHDSQELDAARFEQPTTARGTLRLGDRTVDFQGRGERDHSWGPRPWNMEWTFLVVGDAALRLQCVEVALPGMPPFGVGYLHRDTTQSLSAVELTFTFDHGSLTAPFTGRFAVVAEDGIRLAGRVEPITTAEIDITHTFVPPERSVYRRALVRVHLDGGGAPLMGWVEYNRFLRPA